MSVPAAAVHPRPLAVHAPRRERTLARSALLLTGAMGVSGILTYAFLVVTARALGPSTFGEVGALWGGMYIVSIVLFRPLEQTMSRAIADRRTRGEEGRTVLRSVGLVALGIAAVVLVTAAAAWNHISRGLFRGDSVMTALLVAGVVFYGCSYLVRGVVGGVMWFDGYGINVLAEGVARLLIAGLLVFAASKQVASVAVIGAGLGGALAPLLFGSRRISRALAGHRGERFHVGKALAFAAPASTVAAADQLLVSGGPLLIMVAGGPGAGKAAGIAFAATMLVRAPVYVFQGVAAALLPNFTNLQSGDRSRELWQATLKVTRLVALAGAGIVVVVAVAGPFASRLFYGNGFQTTRTVLVWLALGVCFYLVDATLSQSLFALDAGVDAAVAWSAAAAIFVASYVLLPGSQLFRLAVAFAGATCALLVLLAAALWRRVGSG